MSYQADMVSDVNPRVRGPSGGRVVVRPERDGSS